MTEPKRRRTTIAVCIAAILLVSHGVKADIGLLRLQESSGPFSISVFTEPTPLREGEGILHVFVSDRHTGRPLQDVTVEALLVPSDEEGQELARALARRPKSLRASADLGIPSAGRWSVRISAASGIGKGVVGFEIDVLPAQPWWVSLGPALAIPPVGIALFALHRRLRLRLASGRRTGAMARASGVKR